jgi:hypothetical protein
LFVSGWTGERRGFGAFDAFVGDNGSDGADGIPEREEVGMEGGAVVEEGVGLRSMVVHRERERIRERVGGGEEESRSTIILTDAIGMPRCL